MVEYVLTINSRNGKSYKKELTEQESDNFLNKKLKDNIKGDLIGFKGYSFKITGGSDKHGFPIREDVSPGARKKPLVVSGTGAKLKEKGVKQRKTVRGNIIDDNIKQINLKVEKEGTTKLEEVFGSSNEEKSTEQVTIEKNSKKNKKETSEEKEQVKGDTEETNKDEGNESEEKEK